MKITTAMTHAAYELAKKVNSEEIQLKYALDEMEGKYGMNRGSATDYVYNLKHMLAGETYARTNNAEATDYFLSRILLDYGYESFLNALISVDKHIKYYKTVGKSKLPGIRKVYEKYLSISKIKPFQEHSWTIENCLSAYKVLDKSAFLHRGTGIPIEIRPFFLDGELGRGERKGITLVYQDQAYQAHIAKEAEHLRTRLFWNADFSSLLRETFPHHYLLYSQDQQPESSILLRLTRLKGFDSYEVSISGEVSEDIAANDIEADELEDRGPAKEGAVKEYYGKRYERSPQNRKAAIKIHGLSCNACGFNFEKVYGARGADYIEVHHIKPIHTYEEEQHVDPRTDLITVCSNCHRMIHRDPSNILSIEALKTILLDLRGTP